MVNSWSIFQAGVGINDSTITTPSIRFLAKILINIIRTTQMPTLDNKFKVWRWIHVTNKIS